MPKSIDLRVDGVAAPVEVRRHPKARRMTLRISHARRAVIVTLPMRCAKDEANRFVARHIDWVRSRLHAMPELRSFCDGGVVPVRGVLHDIRFVSGDAVARPASGRTIVWTETAADDSAQLHVRGERAHCARRLQDWLIGEARKDLDKRVSWHARNLDLRPRRIAVRDQTSRWGSCSSTGVLSFSWRLILAPVIVLDYVAAHEVAHLAEMNHGPQFWRLVAQTMPQMDRARQWLHEHGHELHAYGVGS